MEYVQNYFESIFITLFKSAFNIISCPSPTLLIYHTHNYNIFNVILSDFLSERNMVFIHLWINWLQEINSQERKRTLSQLDILCPWFKNGNLDEVFRITREGDFI